jgi:hypothetical protein
VLPAAEELMDEARDSTSRGHHSHHPDQSGRRWALGVDVTIGWRCHLDQASDCRIISSPTGPVLFGFNETRRSQNVVAPIM